jgi:hypothetical protein
VIQPSPDAAQATRAEALNLLRQGRFAEAWPLYEARRWTPGTNTLEPITAAPRWRGEDLSGKRIVVCAEQGFGDQLMFGRYLPLLRERGANVVIACHPRHLARLFERAGYETRPNYNDRPLPDCDYWTHFGSLPGRLSPQPPAPAWLNLPLTTGGGVGVMAQGNPKFVDNAARSLPPRFAAQLHSLGRDLSPAATGAVDFLDTAELMAGLDLVVSVCTSVAHLAGALGKPLIVLLHDRAEWRWGLGARSPWYPEATLIRQDSPGDWRGVMERLLKSCHSGYPHGA